DNDISFVATKVGDRFVLEEMLKEGYVFGGEHSGHVIFKDYASTGDGQLTSIQLLSLVKRSGKKLSELAEVMKRYPQCIINVTVSKEGKLAFPTTAFLFLAHNLILMYNIDIFNKREVSICSSLSVLSSPSCFCP
ncbi:MAG: hypothetical protein II376_00120, partial [Clostridia bacterium]|nr:hypothetical protein [Clostridia bacterium]